MDLYLMSPVFLKKMMPKSSSAASPSPDDSPGLKDLDLDDALPEREENSESEGEMDPGASSYYRSGRRRSSLDRMLRQHAYIIICMVCYACTLPGQVT